MSVKPILFNGPMVRAALERRKTQTRRALKDQPRADEPIVAPSQLWVYDSPWVWRNGYDGSIHRLVNPQPPYAVGDLLYVKEAWRADARLDRKRPSEIKTKHPNISYVATSDPDDFGVEGKPRAPIHMPRWASRLTLEVTGVKIERVQDISFEDCKAEGHANPLNYHENVWRAAARDWFMDFWDGLNAKRGHGWDENHWVCVATFKVRRMNVDQYLRGQST